MSRRWIPRSWNRPLTDYLESAGQAGRNGPSVGGETRSAQEQSARFERRLEQDRREMAAIVGREFLP